MNFLLYIHHHYAYHLSYNLLVSRSIEVLSAISMRFNALFLHHSPLTMPSGRPSGSAPCGVFISVNLTQFSTQWPIRKDVW